jgi:uncharacterized protein (TIGR02271 family)
MAQTVIGIFDNATEAQNAAQQLISNGFSRDSIDISSQSSSAAGYGATSSSRTADDNDFGDKVGNFFSSLFGSDQDDSRKYSTVASRGTVVTVHTRSMQEAERAADILDQFGAVDVDDRHKQYSSNMTGTSSAATTAGFADTTTSRVDTDITDRGVVDADRSIPIIEENLQVGKRVVETGGIRLRSRIIERPVEEHLRLRVEHVHVERVPVNRPVSSADMAGFQEGTIEMTESAEVPIVNKEARIVEEVRLNKEVTERDEVIRDTVRRTDVDVDNIASTDTGRVTDRDDSFLNNNRLDRDNDGRLDADDLNRPANR